MLLLVVAVVLGLTWAQFRGYFDKKASLVVMAERAGLSMDPGSKVTFNGVPIGRLKSAGVVTDGEESRAKLLLDVEPRYLNMIPANVDAELRATTVFGNKYISFLSPADPSSDKLKPGAVINATSTTTEFNTLFETIMGDRPAAGSGEAEPDVDRGRAGAGRVGRQVRPVAGQRERHPG